MKSKQLPIEMRSGRNTDEEVAPRQLHVRTTLQTTGLQASLPPSLLVRHVTSVWEIRGLSLLATSRHRTKKRKKGPARRPSHPSTRPQPQLLHASNSTSSSSVLQAAGLCWLMQGRIKLSWSRLSPVLRCNADLFS